MDGTIANLRAICDLADRYDALVMVDDSHSTGFMGATGRGTPEHCGVADRIDILTSTLGKALGGASGGFVSSRKEVVDWLRKRSRPYLFSNSIPPVVAGVSLRVLDLLENSPELRAQLFDNTRHFRAGLEKAGFNLKPGEHPIIPVMLGDAALAGRMAEQLLQRGVYVIGFSFPVVPKGQARIRTQMSAALTREQLDRAIEAFTTVGQELGVITLKALVKKEAAPGIWLDDVPEPKVGPNDVLIEIAKTAICGTDMHIYKWDAWAQKTIPVPDGRRPRILRPHRRDGLRGPRPCDRRPRLRRRTHHVRLLPQLPCRPPPSVPQHCRCRCEPPGRVRAVPVDPGGQHFQAAGLHQRRRRLDSRSVRQRHSHGAGIQHGGRGRADHRRRPDRHHGGRHRPLRRRAARRHHRRERLSPRPRPQDGRHARHQCHARVAR